MTGPQWNFDMSLAPRGRVVETKFMQKINGEEREITKPNLVMDRVWVAVPDGNVYSTYWIPEKKFGGGKWGGRWAGMTDKEEGIAWMLYEKPKHPRDLGYGG